MNTVKPIFIKVFCLVLLSLASMAAYGSHIVGVDLFYTWVSGSTYKITVIAYGDCGPSGSVAFSTLSYSSPQICIYDGDTYESTINLTIEAPTAGVEITPVCTADLSLTQCTNTSYSIPGIKKFVYSGTYTVPHESKYWRFLFLGYMGGMTSHGTPAEAGRSSAITNIETTPVTTTQLVDTLNNYIEDNSSPELTVIPTPFFCLDNSDNYNPGAVYPSGDSLAFYLVPGMNSGLAGITGPSCNPGSAVTYVYPYTATSPLAASSFSFDSHTGQISFYPNELQRSLVVYNIEQYRNDTLMGTMQREMTFLVLTCTNTAASGGFSSASAGTIVDSTHFQICQNSGAFTLDVNPTEPDDTNDIKVTVAGLPSGCTLVTTGDSTSTPHCTISWTSTGVAPGSYTFYLTFTDNACPLNGVQTLAYTMTILPAASISDSTLLSAGCANKGDVRIIPSGSAYPWTVKISSSPGDTIQTFSSVFASFTDSLYEGTYVATIINTEGCRQSDTIVIPGPVAFPISGTFTNPSYCGINDGTITLSHLYPGIDTIKYYYNGVLQPSAVRTVPADSIITLTGLAPGLYSDILVLYAHCTSISVGTYTLTVPPFSVRAVAGTDPSWCGYCNGSITLYGLHPGQLDTVNYTLGTTSEPAVAHLVGADSTLTISGLCAGTYNYFYAITGSGCLSNTLGPVTLTPPPFTMRALSSTNPSYCGICNGTITIYGLHPGQTDTINYNYNGVAQPAIVSTIGTDSTVILTGMCAGVYDNFVANTGGICVSNTLGPVTLTVPPFTMRAISYTNPDYCGICNGTITLYGLHPGETDTITYTEDGTAAYNVFTIPTDSMVTITGLCAGTYADFVARTGGTCISDTLGPVTLTVPPFTMRAIGYTNPAYCGICNGTITLYGLHPGETDTITYTYDGTAESAVFTIGADSTAELTGLCFGTYADFVAHTGGICVSNTLGPVTLTVPPFTIRALGFTNPDYCGICNGTITVYGLHPGETDTITYTYNGTAESAVFAIGTDSTAVLTGLCFGTYADFVAHTGGVCVSNALGPVTLTVPPFTIGSLTYTNPSECGFCDGTITVHGVHPGETDTLNYTYNGTPKPAVVVTVGDDSTIVLSGLCEGVYTNFVVNTGGVCVSNTLGPVTLVAPPIIPGFTFTIGQGCGGDTLRCINTSSPPAILTYNWNFGDGSAIDTATDPTHIYYNPGSYSIILTITNTKCVAYDTQSITLNNLIAGAYSMSPDSFTCQGKPVTFTNGSEGTDLQYIWYFGDGTTATTTNATHIYTYTGTYAPELVISNYVPCYDTVTESMTIDSFSSISINVSDTVICRGMSLSMLSDYATAGSTSLVWTLGDGSTVYNENPITYSFDETGTFTVTVQANYRACPSVSTSQQIYVSSYPTVNIGSDTAMCPGSPAITIGDMVNTIGTWHWNTGQTTPSIEVIEPGTYYVTVSVGGCTATDSVIVRNDCYLDIPNAFTPNGDGFNDYFFPRDDLARGLNSFHMSIFNRWGEVIFETNRIDGSGWDGRFNNVPQPEGVYIYMIDATFIDGEKEHRQGNVTLLR